MLLSNIVAFNAGVADVHRSLVHWEGEASPFWKHLLGGHDMHRLYFTCAGDCLLTVEPVLLFLGFSARKASFKGVLPRQSCLLGPDPYPTEDSNDD